MNLSNNLSSAALFFPDRPAVCHNGKEISYAGLNEFSSRIAGGLIKSGIHKGDLIALCAPNSIEWIAFYFGVIRAGASAVTLSSLLKSDELAHLLGHSRPRHLYTSDQILPEIKKIQASVGIEKIISPSGDMDLDTLAGLGSPNFPAADMERGDTAAVLYTGGTTGIPKGVMLTHENIITSSHNVAFSEKSTETDRALCFLPFNHVFGQIHIMNGTVISSGCLEILPAFDMDRVLEVIGRGLVTKFYAVPTVYMRLLTVQGLKKKLGNIRYCFSAAASMSAEIVLRWNEVTGLRIHECYGMTETASIVTFNHWHRYINGSVGTAAPGIEVQIRDSGGQEVASGTGGEICIRGRNVMKGYLNNHDATCEAFYEGSWLRSGDIGFLDKDGYLYIVDRLKDMIITGGENVYPREVEEILYGREEVLECAVLGLPDKEWGEIVTAFIVPKEGQIIESEALKSFLKTRISSFKIPKKYIVLDQLPKSPAGKILKRELKNIYSTGSL